MNNETIAAQEESEHRQVSLHSKESRNTYARMIGLIFETWGLDQAVRHKLLGSIGKEWLDRADTDEPLPDDPQLLKRVGHIISVWRQTRICFTNDVQTRIWLFAPTQELKGRAPIDLLQGKVENMLQVRRYIEGMASSVTAPAAIDE